MVNTHLYKQALHFSADEELSTSSAAVTDLLKRNFKSSMAKRTPFGLYIHQWWFDTNQDYGPIRTQGFKE